MEYVYQEGGGDETKKRKKGGKGGQEEVKLRDLIGKIPNDEEKGKETFAEIIGKLKPTGIIDINLFKIFDDEKLKINGKKERLAKIISNLSTEDKDKTIKLSKKSNPSQPGNGTGSGGKEGTDYEGKLFIDRTGKSAATLETFITFNEIIEPKIKQFISELNDIKTTQKNKILVLEPNKYKFIPILTTSESQSRQIQAAFLASHAKPISEQITEMLIDLNSYQRRIKKILDDVMASGDIAILNPNFYIKQLELMNFNLITSIGPNIERIKVLLSSEKLPGEQRPVEQIKEDETKCEPLITNNVTLLYEDRNDYEALIFDLDQMLSLKSDKPKEIFYFDISGNKLKESDAYSHLKAINGNAFLFMLRYFCYFMKEDSENQMFSNKEERLIILNDIMPYLINFNKGFKKPYDQFNFKEYIKDDEHKRQLLYLSIIHQVHFMGTIYNVTNKVECPKFNPNEGEEIKDIENYRKNIFLNKFNYVTQFYNELQISTLPQDSPPNFTPSNILKKMDEYVRKMAKDLEMPDWRLQSFSKIVKKMETPRILKKTLSKRKSDTEELSIEPTISTTKPSTPKWTKEEEEKFKKLLEDADNDEERKVLLENKENGTSFELLNKIYSSMIKNKQKDEEKVSSHYGKKKERLNKLVEYYANKNNQSSIWKKMIDETNKRKSKEITLDDLDKVVSDVFKEVERIYNGMSETQKSDVVLSSVYKRNEKERIDLLTEINYLRSLAF